jgi:hypothetical protein
VSHALDHQVTPQEKFRCQKIRRAGRTVNWSEVKQRIWRYVESIHKDLLKVHLPVRQVRRKSPDVGGGDVGGHLKNVFYIVYTVPYDANIIFKPTKCTVVKFEFHKSSATFFGP